MNNELEESLINEFLDDFHEVQKEIRDTLIQLEHYPEDINAASALFRSVHSVKSNLQKIGLNSFSGLIHRLEDLLDDVRKNHRQFSQLLSDLILLNIDAVYVLCTHTFKGANTDVELTKYLDALNQLHNEDNDEILLLKAIRIFDPEYETDTEQQQCSDNITDDASDISLFENLAKAMEQRLVGKLGSTDRIMEIALEMNALAGGPVEVSQLQTAVKMHDAAMAFLPLPLINKKDRYTDEERDKLHGHPMQSAKLLQSLENWAEASMIVMQHHERIDGKGYPNGLKGDEICDGAKILAIADTFESMSQLRADREHRRTIIRIIAELNANINTQFDAFWVDVFNRYAKNTFLKKAA